MHSFPIPLPGLPGAARTDVLKIGDTNADGVGFLALRGSPDAEANFESILATGAEPVMEPLEAENLKGASEAPEQTEAPEEEGGAEAGVILDEAESLGTEEGAPTGPPGLLARETQLPSLKFPPVHALGIIPQERPDTPAAMQSTDPARAIPPQPVEPVLLTARESHPAPAQAQASPRESLPTNPAEPLPIPEKAVTVIPENSISNPVVREEIGLAFLPGRASEAPASSAMPEGLKAPGHIPGAAPAAAPAAAAERTEGVSDDLPPVPTRPDRPDTSPGPMLVERGLAVARAVEGMSAVAGPPAPHVPIMPPVDPARLPERPVVNVPNGSPDRAVATMEDAARQTRMTSAEALPILHGADKMLPPDRLADALSRAAPSVPGISPQSPVAPLYVTPFADTETELLLSQEQRPISEAGQTQRAAGPGSTPAADIPRQIAAQITETILQRGPGRLFDVVLSPAELGRVKISLNTVDGALSVQLVAERPETLDLMRRHADALAQEFRALGFGDASFSFQQHRFGQDQAGHSGPDHTGAPSPSDLGAPEQAETQITRVTLTPERVDIRL